MPADGGAAVLRHTGGEYRHPMPRLPAAVQVLPDVGPSSTPMGSGWRWIGPSCAAAASPTHAPPHQDGGGDALRSGDQIQAVVHAVDEIDVGGAGGGVEGLRAGGAPAAVGMITCSPIASHLVLAILRKNVVQ